MTAQCSPRAFHPEDWVVMFATLGFGHPSQNLGLYSLMNGPQRTACFAKGMHNYTFHIEQYTFLIL